MPSILDEAANNVRLALFHVQALRQLRSLAPKFNIDGLLSPLLADGFNSAFSPNTPVNLAWYVGGNGSRKVLYIDGVQTDGQASSLIGGYSDQRGGSAFTVQNQWLIDQADRIIDAMTAGHWVEPEYLDFVGYSAGGAVAQIVMWRYVTRQSVTKRKLITFGSPRAQPRLQRDQLSSSPVARWFTDADPVPLIPPRMADVSTLVAIISPLQTIQYGNFVHTDGGISVAQNGVTTPAVLPPVAEVDPGSSLASWYFLVEGSGTNPHALSTYYAYLQAAVNALPRPDEQTVPVAEDENPQQERQRDVTRRQRQIADAINEAGRAQNNVGLEIPPETLMIPHRLGRVWVVSFNGDVICTAPIEKRARAIARAGNAFLRALPKQALVDPIALSQQLTNWLGMAQDPTFGFVPQINTKIEV